MLEKSPVTRISILRSMAGHSEDSESRDVVPQNSVTTIRQRMGLSEKGSKPNEPILLKSKQATQSKSSRNSVKQCAHCENMAKNFLYLENLLRTNYDSEKQCTLCYSAIKYLEYVNKSILDIFGSFEDISSAVGGLKKGKAARKTGTTRKTSAQTTKTKSDKVKSGSKANIKRQEGGGIASLQNFSRARAGTLTKTHTKKAKTSTSIKSEKSKLKPKKRKTTKKLLAGSKHSVGTTESIIESSVKVKRIKKKPKSTKIIIVKQKSTKTKSKRKKISKSSAA